MKTAIIYVSQTGFTRRYAEWLAEMLQAECLPFNAAKSKDFSEYDAIVFGSWACAGKICKTDWLKQQLPRWTEKKIAVFCTGGSPSGSPSIQPFLEQNIPSNASNPIAVFYPKP